MVLEKLQDSEHDVVDIAEPGRLALLGMVQASGPVDGNVAVAVVELDGAPDGAPGVGLAEIVEPVEHGAILAHVEALELPHLVVLSLRRDFLQEGDVVVGVEAAEVAIARGVGAQHLHARVQVVVHKQRVRHPNAVRLHGVPLPVVVVPHVGIIEVGDAALAPLRPRHQRIPPFHLSPLSPLLSSSPLYPSPRKLVPHIATMPLQTSSSSGVGRNPTAKRTATTCGACPSRECSALQLDQVCVCGVLVCAAVLLRKRGRRALWRSRDASTPAGGALLPGRVSEGLDSTREMPGGFGGWIGTRGRFEGMVGLISGDEGSCRFG
jgi:hypothetical protein